jgi:hypothetical protein
MLKFDKERCSGSMGRYEDVRKNETSNGLNQLKSFVEENSHTAVIQMRATHI